MRKIKIINDPVGGFIRIYDDLLFQIIDHFYFQRLRRIRQLGLTELVFPGAIHNRFQHTLGAFQLMSEVLSLLKIKGVEISEEEERAAKLGILLHDVGHAPFSHTLEYVITPGISHEDLTICFMEALNQKFNGQLSMALQVFKGQYSRGYLHQLISGQMDVDRLDYLRRDSFYSGVSEGKIGSERIVRMFNVVNDELVVEQKGIYSIEHFLIARRTMYWQVYLHKTVSCAERMLVEVVNRARELETKGIDTGGSKLLQEFLKNRFTLSDFRNQKVLNNFAALSDTDIFYSLKSWSSHNDFILSDLSSRLLNRQLFRIELLQQPFDEDYVADVKNKVREKFKLDEQGLKYYCYQGQLQNTTYSEDSGEIKILLNDQTTTTISDPAMGFNSTLITNPEVKYFLCYPKELISE